MGPGFESQRFHYTVFPCFSWLKRTFSVYLLSEVQPCKLPRTTGNPGRLGGFQEVCTMARPRNEVPSYRLHVSGQACVDVGNRRIYLGKHGSKESKARYFRLCQLLLNVGEIPNDFQIDRLDPDDVLPKAVAEAEGPILVTHVTEAFRQHLVSRPRMSQSDRQRMKVLCDELDRHAGKIEADTFGPKKLRELRDKWTQRYDRRYCNRLASAVRRIFRYAVSEELVSESAWTRLKSLDPLREGDAPIERAERECVALEHVQATLKHLHSILADVVTLQLHLALRPSEVLSIKPCEIDRSGAIWVYHPTYHKTKSRGHRRVIVLDGFAQRIVDKYLERPADAYLFSPKEAVSTIRSKAKAERVARGGSGSRKKPRQKQTRLPGDRYYPREYAKAIQRAATKAGVPQWSPYQLRHTGITLMAEKAGVDNVQALAGHSKRAMTIHYSKATIEKASEALRFGVGPQVLSVT